MANFNKNLKIFSCGLHTKILLFQLPTNINQLPLGFEAKTDILVNEIMNIFCRFWIFFSFDFDSFIWL